MKLQNAKRIIKDLDLNCTAQEFVDYYNSLDLSDLKEQLDEEVNVQICTFDQPYNGVKIDNPANGKYYYYFTIKWRTYLQYHIPYVGWLQPLTDENINNVIEDHKNRVIEEYIEAEKINRTIEHFSNK